MDDIKLFAKNEKELETLIQTSQYIGMEFSIEKCATQIMIGLVWFYGISTFTGYLISNPV